MKLITSSTLICAVSANLEAIIDKFTSMHMEITGADRIFSGAIANSIATMNEMGCWCFFDEDSQRGHGIPIDGLDQLCKNLNNCYACAIFDGEQEGSDACAEPYNIDYQTILNNGGSCGDVDGFAINTGNAASDGLQRCASRVCSCELSFVENLLAFFIGGGAINPDNKHANGFVFDPREGDCAVDGSRASEPGCCGNYPLRRPFKKLDGERECCGTRIFSTVAGMQCCDAAISKIGYTC